MDRVFAKKISGIICRSEPKNKDAQRRSESALDDQRSRISHPIQIRRKSSRMVLSERLAAWQSAEGVSISEKIQEIYGNGFMQHLARSTETLRTEGQRMSGERLWTSCARQQTNTIPVKKFPISSTNADVVQRAGKTFRMIDDATFYKYLKTFSDYMPQLTFLKLFTAYCKFDDNDTDYIGQIEALKAFRFAFNSFYLAESLFGDQQIGDHKKKEMLNYLKKFFDRGYDQEMKDIKAQMSEKIRPRLFLLVKMLCEYSTTFSNFFRSPIGSDYDLCLAKLSEIYGSLNAFMSSIRISLNYTKKNSNSSYIEAMREYSPERLFSSAESALEAWTSCDRILNDGWSSITDFISHTDNIISQLEAIVIILLSKKYENNDTFSSLQPSKTERNDTDECCGYSESPKHVPKSSPRRSNCQIDQRQSRGKYPNSSGPSEKKQTLEGFHLKKTKDLGFKGSINSMVVDHSKDMHSPGKNKTLINKVNSHCGAFPNIRNWALKYDLENDNLSRKAILNEIKDFIVTELVDPSKLVQDESKGEKEYTVEELANSLTSISEIVNLELKKYA